MTTCCRSVLLLPLLGVLACNDASAGSGYVFLADLCDTYVEDVCSARGRCCDASPTDCRSELTAQCVSARKAIEDRDGAGYDTEAAGTVRAEHVAALSTCEPAFPLARFFSGGAALSARCETDAECASGACALDRDNGRCVEPDPAPLCDPS